MWPVGPARYVARTSLEFDSLLTLLPSTHSIASLNSITIKSNPLSFFGGWSKKYLPLTFLSLGVTKGNPPGFFGCHANTYSPLAILSGGNAQQIPPGFFGGHSNTYSPPDTLSKKGVLSSVTADRCSPTE